MIVNPDILRRDTLALLKQIDQQIEEVEYMAKDAGIKPHRFRLSDGSWPMIPLIAAKAQAYSTLVLLQTKR